MIRTTLINYQGRELEVTFDFFPGEKEIWTLPNGDPGYPGYPDELEITQVYLGNRNITGLLKVSDFERITKIIENGTEE